VEKAFPFGLFTAEHGGWCQKKATQGLDQLAAVRIFFLNCGGHSWDNTCGASNKRVLKGF